MRWLFLTVAWAPDEALSRLPTVREYWQNRKEHERRRIDAWNSRRRRNQRGWYEAEKTWDAHVASQTQVDTIADALANADELTILVYARWCAMGIREHSLRGERRIAGWFVALRSVLRNEHARRCEGVVPPCEPTAALRDVAARLTDDDLDAVGVGCMFDMSALRAVHGDALADLMLALNEPIRLEWRRRPLRWDALSGLSRCE